MLSYLFSFLYSNHIDLKIGTFYIKKLCASSVMFKLYRYLQILQKLMIIFENYEMLSEWLQSAP